VSSTDANARILVVEDDPSIQLGLRMNLEREGYEVDVASDGEVALAGLRGTTYDLCILDLMLPRLNGYELLARLRHERLRVPILILSARSGEDDKVMGLDLGAEDFVTKPFSVPELLARVRAALRRRRPEPTTTSFRFGEVAVDLATREVTRAGEPVELTVTEFNILAALAQAEGNTLSRDEIFQVVWGQDHHGTRRTIDNFVAQLRGKLENDPGAPSHLLTVRGVGYRLVS
jgi:DNA-binding response OmpR family regulator